MTVVYHIVVQENPKNDFGVFGTSDDLENLCVCQLPLARRKPSGELERGGKMARGNESQRNREIGNGCDAAHKFILRPLDAATDEIPVRGQARERLEACAQRAGGEARPTSQFVNRPRAPGLFPHVINERSERIAGKRDGRIRRAGDDVQQQIESDTAQIQTAENASIVRIADVEQPLEVGLDSGIALEEP